MAKDISALAQDALGQAVKDATKRIGSGGKRRSPLAGAGGVAVGAGLAALAPVAAKRAVQAVKRRLGGDGGDGGNGNGGDGGGAVAKATSKVGDAVGGKVKEKASGRGIGDLAKDAGKSVLPSSGDGGRSEAAPGVGEGRRMPVQQSVDVAVPVSTAYNQWTQFEDWPDFMHRVTRVEQEDPCTVAFTTKIWGKSKRFNAKIETQRPDERIKWRVTEGIDHTGVVTFHELGPRLTRIELTVDVAPGGLLEKAARGMRHIKRAMRADLHRFKAFIEMQEQETGAWRGRIEDGELVEEHAGDDGAGRSPQAGEDATAERERRPVAAGRS